MSVYWPNTTGFGSIGYDPAAVIPEPKSEWSHLIIHSDGSLAGTRVTWHGDDITDQVGMDFVAPAPPTERAPSVVDTPCPQCHGYGWGRTSWGKDVPCKACYGRGR